MMLCLMQFFEQKVCRCVFFRWISACGRQQQLCSVRSTIMNCRASLFTFFCYSSSSIHLHISSSVAVSSSSLFPSRHLPIDDLMCMLLSFLFFFSPCLSLLSFPLTLHACQSFQSFFLSHHLSVTISISSITLSCSSHFGSHFHFFFLSSLHSHTVFFSSRHQISFFALPVSTKQH